MSATNEGIRDWLLAILAGLEYREPHFVGYGRRLLDRHMGPGECGRCAEVGEIGKWPCTEVAEFAAMFARRPGYREEWAA